MDKDDMDIMEDLKDHIDVLRNKLEAAEKLLAQYKYDKHKDCCPQPCTAEVDKIIVENQKLRICEAALREALIECCVPHRSNGKKLDCEKCMYDEDCIIQAALLQCGGTEIKDEL